MAVYSTRLQELPIGLQAWFAAMGQSPSFAGKGFGPSILTEVEQQLQQGIAEQDLLRALEAYSESFEGLSQKQGDQLVRQQVIPALKGAAAAPRGRGWFGRRGGLTPRPGPAMKLGAFSDLFGRGTPRIREALKEAEQRAGGARGPGAAARNVGRARDLRNLINLSRWGRFDAGLALGLPLVGMLAHGLREQVTGHDAHRELAGQRKQMNQQARIAIMDMMTGQLRTRRLAEEVKQNPELLNVIQMDHAMKMQQLEQMQGPRVRGAMEL